MSKVNTKSIGRKVGLDLFIEQMGWTGWFIGITFIIHLIKVVFATYQGDEVNVYYLSGHISSGIYMLVIGIIVGHAFLSFYVENGVTRKDFFIGGLLAATGLSIAIPTIVLLITSIEIFVVKLLNLSIIFETSFKAAIEDDGKVGIGNVVSHIINGPGIDLDSNWFLSTFVFMLNLIFYYLLGWMVASSFQRYGFMVGLGTIVLSYTMILIRGWLWGDEVRGYIAYILPFDKLDLPLHGFIIGSLVLTALSGKLIRLFTRRMPIKI